MQYLYPILGSVFAVLITEYVVRKFKLSFGPVKLLTIIADVAQETFYKIGRFIARISSFLVYLNLRQFIIDIFNIVADICLQFWRIITSYVYFAKGYAEQLYTYIGDRGLVITGSVILVGIVCYLFYAFVYRTRYIQVDA